MRSGQAWDREGEAVSDAVWTFYFVQSTVIVLLIVLVNATILITGGVSFIGSNLCAYFLNVDAKVTCLDLCRTANES
ncbi:hypothetical protein [Nitritalea halalkaliphila]|uniref:hypothetical protein n=1 Tax=Nitritalea halalkaliphila TaxID=590849 RepID=UPI000308A31A|nr:hypothetical protein [Nitritalea halalkaliphila]